MRWSAQQSQKGSDMRDESDGSRVPARDSEVLRRPLIGSDGTAVRWMLASASVATSVAIGWGLVARAGLFWSASSGHYLSVGDPSIVAEEYLLYLVLSVTIPLVYVGVGGICSLELGFATAMVITGLTFHRQPSAAAGLSVLVLGLLGAAFALGRRCLTDRSNDTGCHRCSPSRHRAP
jgi:hypothetical protein